jgi:hypothetical protein
MTKFICYSFIIFLSSCSNSESFNFLAEDSYKYSSHHYTAPAGLVTSPAAAAGIAEIVAKTVYGEEQIQEQKPLIVSFNRDIWYVRGQRKKASFGGVVEIEVSKIDGRILRISHGQ